MDNIYFSENLSWNVKLCLLLKSNISDGQKKSKRGILISNLMDYLETIVPCSVQVLLLVKYSRFKLPWPFDSFKIASST